MNALKANRTVLLVEDSDDDAFFFERSFKNATVEVQLIRVANGSEAIDFLQTVSQESRDLSQSHLVFLDLKLPVLSGFEVLKWIKEQSISVEVVILSGSDIQSDIDFALALGAADFLVKPISAQELKKRLAREPVAS